MKPIPTPDPLVIEPVIKTVDVPLPVEKAFHLFTEGYARWWPLATHSVGLKRALSCTLETHVGGRIYETLDDGTHCEWGTVQIWEPPHRLVFTWHPGQPASTAQQVEILIQPARGESRDGQTIWVAIAVPGAQSTMSPNLPFIVNFSAQPTNFLARKDPKLEREQDDLVYSIVAGRDRVRVHSAERRKLLPLPRLAGFRVVCFDGLWS